MELGRALSLIRPIPDYPKPGILFQDITPLLANGEAFEAVTAAISDIDDAAQIAIGVEARGFILASALANKRGIGFVPVRKKGKLPADTFSRSYGLEYGDDEVEIHKDAFVPGSKVTLIDDVLATGGTLEAAIALIGDAGGVITSIIVLLEIGSLGGRKRLEKVAPEISVHALVVI